MNRPNRFSFIDEGEVVRRLDVDRDTVLAFVREGRLRAYPGVGKGSFYRVSEVDALAVTLRGAQAEQAGQTTDADANATGASTRKVFDPAYKVHVRMQADLKWYDLADEELQAWVRELHPDGYERQRTNVTQVIAKLQRLVALMDDAASHWTTRERAAAGLAPTAPAKAVEVAPIAPMSAQPALIQMTPRRRTPSKAEEPPTSDSK
ncbi:MAG TPA: hypothetical protein VMV29_05490 [Ktedonobacterales bacterium]|nr:hypothetical protein [Ktedonobacterales bacterium]